MTAAVAAAPVVLLIVVAGALARRAGAARRARPVSAPVGSVPEALREAIVRPVAAVLRSGRAHEVEPTHLVHLRTALERGGSLLQGFDDVAAGPGPQADAARRLTRRVRAGAGVQESIDQWVAEGADPSAALVADALAIASVTGGSQVRAVDAVIDAVRDRAALAREVRALASQARASAAVLVVMPVGFAAVVAASDPRVRAFTFGTVLGPLCVAAGVALDAAGAWWMLRLVRSVR